MADILRKMIFTNELRGAVQDFDCGGEEWERPLNDWIKAESSVKNGALAEMKKATSKGKRLDVWLHVNEADEFVGYSSLGESNWRWPTPDDPRVPISIVPCVAIRKQFHRKPNDPPRYSKQIVDHLVFEATQRKERQPMLGLYVDPRNIAAVTVYRREGFVDFQTYTDTDSGIIYQGMILKIEDYRPHLTSATA